MSAPAATTTERGSQLHDQQPALVAGAAIAVLAVGADIALPFGHLSTALVAGAALAPVTVSTVLRSSRTLTWLLGLSAAAVVFGLWLALRSSERHFSHTAALDDVTPLLTLALGAALIYWARTMLPDHWVALLFGLGLLARTLTASGLYAVNPWKFGFSLPVTIIALSIAWALRSQKLAFVMLLLLALAGALNDLRSGFALLVLTALLLLWSRRPRHGIDGRWLGSVCLLVLAVVGVYKLAETLILDGYLGQETQARTQAQLQVGHSLFLGSRPELGATLALMKSEPAGFGIGVQPTPNDVVTAKQGMASLGHPADPNYVDHYMFGSGVELHSVTGDLWAHFGALGLALAVFILCVALRGVAKEASSASARVLVIYLGVRVLRDIIASPIGTSVLIWALFLGLVAVPGAAVIRSRMGPAR